MGLVMLFTLSTAATAKDGLGKAVSEIGYIQLGHISRIDAKSHILMLVEQKNDKTDQGAAPPRVGGFGRGRFGRFGGLPPWAGARGFETKVVLTPETILNGREGVITFDALKVGDFVEVKGVMRGKQFQAKEVRRHSDQHSSPLGDHERFD
jgi:hypothetical protein